MEVLSMAADQPNIPLYETPKAFRVSFDVKHDLDRAQVTIESWSMPGFSIDGRDLFALLDRLPAEIEAWFQRKHGIEVLVLPVYSAHDQQSRRLEDGYVAIPIRPLIATVRALEPKP
jgi:hypothetical protein